MSNLRSSSVPADSLSMRHAGGIVRYRFGTWQLLAVLVLLAVCFQGTRGLWERDEGRYAAMAMQMLDSGDWWLPAYNIDEPHLAKPPLTYWVVAVAMKLFGGNEWAMRMPFALAFVLTGWLVMILARQLHLQRPWFAAVIWASSIAPFIGGNIIMPDPLLALCEAAAFAAFVQAGGVQRLPLQRKWLVAMWLAFALAFMTKGPPSLLPLLAMMMWLIWQRRWSTLPALFPLAGLALFVLIGFGWYAQLSYTHPQWVRYFLGYEFVARVFTDTHHRNSEWIDMARVYGPTLLLGGLPWLPTLLLRRGESGVEATADVGRLLLCWMAVPLVVFMLSQSRLPHYLLPLFVPLALLVARHLESVSPIAQSRLLRFAALWCVLLIAAKVVLSHVHAKADARALSDEVHALSTRMSRTPHKVVFVEQPPAYGLRFYLRVTVSGAVLTVDEAEFANGEVFKTATVCQLAQTREAILWLVPSTLAETFSTQVTRCGFASHQLASQLRKWTPYEVR